MTIVFMKIIETVSKLFKTYNPTASHAESYLWTSHKLLNIKYLHKRNITSKSGWQTPNPSEIKVISECDYKSGFYILRMFVKRNFPIFRVLVYRNITSIAKEKAREINEKQFISIHLKINREVTIRAKYMFIWVFC